MPKTNTPTNVYEKIMGIIVPLLDSRTATGGEGRWARLSGDRHSNKQIILLHGVPNSTLPASRRQRDCKKLNRDRNNPPLRGALGRYLQIRNGLANSFPTTSATDPTVGVRFRFWARRPKNPIRMPLRTDRKH